MLLNKKPNIGQKKSIVGDKNTMKITKTDFKNMLTILKNLVLNSLFVNFIEVLFQKKTRNKKQNKKEKTIQL